MKVRRTFALDHAAHALTVTDDLEGNGKHAVEIPLHLAVGVTAELAAGSAMLVAGGRRFELTWSSTHDWNVAIEDVRVSPTYGVVVPTKRLVWRRSGTLVSLAVHVAPTGWVSRA